MSSQQFPFPDTEDLGRGLYARAPQGQLKVVWRVAGAHVQARVFSGGPTGTLAMNGELRFAAPPFDYKHVAVPDDYLREGEFARFVEALRLGCLEAGTDFTVEFDQKVR